MEPKDLKDRTRKFALRIIKLVHALPPGKISDVIGYQLLKCGTSVGANYRAACRAKSVADFISKLGIVEEETDESIYWMELIVDAKLIRREDLKPLIQEADEILSIVVASIRTSRSRLQVRGRSPQSAIRNPKSQETKRDTVKEKSS